MYLITLQSSRSLPTPQVPLTVICFYNNIYNAAITYTIYTYTHVYKYCTDKFELTVSNLSQ